MHGLAIAVSVTADRGYGGSTEGIPHAGIQCRPRPWRSTTGHNWPEADFSMITFDSLLHGAAWPLRQLGLEAGRALANAHPSPATVQAGRTEQMAYIRATHQRSVVPHRTVSHANTPDPRPADRPEGEPRLDVHNANVDEDTAKTGRCGTVDLRTGRVCRLPALHPGGCDFEPPHDPVM